MGSGISQGGKMTQAGGKREAILRAQMRYNGDMNPALIPGNNTH